jgi:hypothetical protein
MKSKAIFTLQHNEQFYLPIWIKWYGKTFKPEDMYILAHNTTEPTLSMLKKAESDGINVIYLETDVIFDHEWLTATVHQKQRELLERYTWVMYTDCDELVEPTDCTLEEFIENAEEDAYRCDGFEIQEKTMYRSIGFCKTLLTRVALTYVHGYHNAIPVFPIYNTLRLYHIHKIDFQQAWERNQRIAAENWDAFALANRLGTQNSIAVEQDFRDWFNRDIPTGPGEVMEVPDELWKKILG